MRMVASDRTIFYPLYLLVDEMHLPCQLRAAVSRALSSSSLSRRSVLTIFRNARQALFPAEPIPFGWSSDSRRKSAIFDVCTSRPPENWLTRVLSLRHSSQMNNVCSAVPTALQNYILKLNEKVFFMQKCTSIALHK